MEAPKNLKEALDKSIHKKSYQFLQWIGKNPTKRNIEKTMWQNRLISKKNHHWRDVAIKVWISMPFWQKRPRRRFQKTHLFFFLGNLRVFFLGAFVIILGFLEPSWAMLERHLWVVRSHVGPVLAVLSFCCSVFCLSTVFHTAFCWETFQYLSEYRIY